jgi:hypothetical protein
MSSKQGWATQKNLMYTTTTTIIIVLSINLNDHYEKYQGFSQDW